MISVKVKFDLPEGLATEARKSGLLNPIELERLVREALRAKRADRLGAARDKLAAGPMPPMTAEEIQAEIDAYRAQGRNAI